MDFWLSAQPQKFEIVAVTDGYKNENYCACTHALSWSQQELLILGADTRIKASGRRIHPELPVTEQPLFSSSSTAVA